MITPYYGEFLISPAPLELSLNYCSHKCAYCFANLSMPDRTADIGGILRFLGEFNERKSLEAELVRQGYPVCFSNKVDPFAATNYKQSIPILEVMSTLGIPVAFQTRGGQGIDDALKIVQPSCWYISVCTADDKLRKRLEPGAPTIES